MKRIMNRLQSFRTLAVLTVALGALLMADLVPAQDLHPTRRPSPMGMARTDLGDAYLRVVYSRPYERGRDVIFGSEEDGALVPWGQLWRTGANEATEITVTEDVLVKGESLPAGTYSLFTTPGEKEWQVHFNSELGLSGAFKRNPETGDFERAYDEANNVVTVTVPVQTIPENDKINQFTIEFDDQEGAETHLVFQWILTEVRVPFTLPE